ncbi:uncharacterized protein LOC127707406 [Mytilus californianus]|uniref:uncharacterized protein LOC127707406 n=1 Tax=Mytilus californianus TaxID=6549 RepID=UPI002247FFE6|nr:uncharacterized protein LOC127707406 [Mytilus californianus]
MEENILHCIMFDQDCFLDVRMIAADKRQRQWNLEFLPEVSDVSKSETIYNRQETPSGTNIVTIDYENEILKSLWISNTILLGSTHDGLYLEKGFPILCSEEGSEVNETDLDILFEYSGINIQQEQINSTSNITLCIEKTKFHGYVKLRIISPELVGRTSPVYFPAKALKQKLFTDLKTSNFFISTNVDPVIGESPALCGAIEDELGTHYSDYVVALTMNEWPQMAKSFINRDRHGWPSPVLIKNIVDQGCGFVATAHPSCKNNDLQWRMSFAKSEQILVRSLNHTQVRAYLFFKSLFRLHLSEPECLSSYMMKNVLFWTLELIPPDVWSTENIMYCVESIVDMLCAYLNEAIIPNFFLPNQNLIDHIEEKTIKKVAEKANDLQDNVLAMIIRYADSSDFKGTYEVSLTLLRVKLLTEPEEERDSLLSMVYFSMYLYLRLQARRYQIKLTTQTIEECFKEKLNSIHCIVPRKAAWYLMKAIELQPDLSTFKFDSVCNLWEINLSCMRTKIVDFWRIPLYIGTFKQIVEDQEFFTNEQIVSIPSFENFLEWVDLTCILDGRQEFRFDNLKYPIILD